MTFAVLFEPELPDHGSEPLPSKISWPLAYDAADGHPEHDLRYVICGQALGYYPASLATLLGDVLGELDALQRGVAHDVSMSGYTILSAELVGDNVIFRDPGPAAELVGTAPFSDVHTALETASMRLWACLKASKPATA